MEVLATSVQYTLGKLNKGALVLRCSSEGSHCDQLLTTCFSLRINQCSSEVVSRVTTYSQEHLEKRCAGMAARAFNPSSEKARQVNLCEFAAGLGYMVSSRPAWAIQF